MADRFRNPAQAVQDAVHPVVIRLPDTGRKVLYVNPTFTVRFNGWTEEESSPLLDYLYEHASKPEFTCRRGVAGRAPWVCGTTGRRGTSRSTTIQVTAG